MDKHKPFITIYGRGNNRSITMDNEIKAISIDVSEQHDIVVVNGVFQGGISVDEIQAHIHYLNNERFIDKFGNPSIHKLSEFELNYCLKKPSIFSKSIGCQKPLKKPYK